MKEKYIPGEGCLCHAHSEAECGCSADWTPREVYELREQRDRYKLACDKYSEDEILCKLQEVTEQRDRLAEALRELCETLLNDKPRDITKSLYKAGDALAAWKGGSNE